jgi:hypothetical protein
LFLLGRHSPVSLTQCISLSLGVSFAFIIPNRHSPQRQQPKKAPQKTILSEYTGTEKPFIQHVEILIARLSSVSARCRPLFSASPSPSSSVTNAHQQHLYILVTDSQPSNKILSVQRVLRGMSFDRSKGFPERTL